MVFGSSSRRGQRARVELWPRAHRDQQCRRHCEELAADVHFLFLSASSKATAPVSSSDFRLDRILGQPPDTASTSFDPSRSTLCVIVSLTACPAGTSSIVHSDGPS